ncbi:hypothetical protein Trydic_g10880 [Trypoxylus dichotomus]
MASVETMLKDRKVTVRELCEMIPDVGKTCINNILTNDLGYAKDCARPTKLMARNSLIPLSLGTKPKSTT